MVGYIFGGDTLETPESLKRKRSIAEALAGRASRSPRNVGEGLSAIGDALIYRSIMGKVDAADAAGRKSAETDRSALLSLFGGGIASGDDASIPMSGAASEVSAVDPGDMTGNQVYNDFMGEVGKTVKNPYGLAAIAATGNAESKFSPGNVNRTWSDPSESGQPGTAGGIMSWRGPRYEALAATGDLSPTGQAKFFVGEDPNLIASLNGAKSLEEAQSAINRAWAFRGYDRPGGEAARRLGLAKGYLPSFQGQGAPAEVASLDPAAGMPQPDAATAIEATAPASGYVDPKVTTGARKASPAVIAALGPTTAAPRQPSPVAAALASPPIPTARPEIPGEMETAAAPASPRNTQVAQALVGGQQQIQAAFRLLSNPYASDADKAVASSILERAQKTSDPAYQMELEKNRIELDNLRNPKISPADQARIDIEREKAERDKNKPTEVGGRLIGPDGKVVYEAPGKWQKLDDGSLFNEATGEFKMAPKPEGETGFRFKGNSVEAQSLNGLIDSKAITPDQAQQIGAGKTITGPNGEIIFMTPQGVFAGDPKAGTAKPMLAPQQAQPDTVDLFGDGGGAQAPVQAPAVIAPAPAAQPQPAPQQRQGMIPLTDKKPEKPLTEAERKNQSLYSVIQPELKVVEDNFDALADPRNQAFSKLPLSEFVTTPEYQKAANSLQTIVSSYLYSVSGATATPEEVKKQTDILTPRPGESKESIESKKQRVRTMVNAVAKTGGLPELPPEPAGMPDFSKMSDEELQRYIDGK